MALIPIPEDKPVRWINPDHVSHLVPAHHQTLGAVDLVVSMKVLGMPVEQIKLGVYDDLPAAQLAWDAFLSYLQAHSHDPANDLR